MPNNQGDLMRVYLYNSYTGSPVGFVMGMLERLPSGGFSTLSEGDIPLDIRACFEHGLVVNALGNFDCFRKAGERWVILLKNLVYEVPDSDYGFTWYLNFAVEAHAWEDIKPLLQSSTAEAARVLAQCLKVAKGDAFGYEIEPEKLAALFETSFLGGEVPQAVIDAAQKGCCFHFRAGLPEKDAIDFLQRYFDVESGLSFAGVSSDKDSGWVLAGKGAHGGGFAPLYDSGIFSPDGLPGESGQSASETQDADAESEQAGSGDLRKTMKQIGRSFTSLMEHLSLKSRDKRIGMIEEAGKAQPSETPDSNDASD